MSENVRLFLNEYFRRKPMRLNEREDCNLFLLEKSDECDYEFLSIDEHLAIMEKLQKENTELVKFLKDGILYADALRDISLQYSQNYVAMQAAINISSYIEKAKECLAKLENSNG